MTHLYAEACEIISVNRIILALISKFLLRWGTAVLPATSPDYWQIAALHANITQSFNGERRNWFISVWVCKQCVCPLTYTVACSFVWFVCWLIVRLSAGSGLAVSWKQAETHGSLTFWGLGMYFYLSECMCMCLCTSIFVRCNLSFRPWEWGYFWEVRTLWLFLTSRSCVKVEDTMKWEI